jgi:hypothetical protein
VIGINNNLGTVVRHYAKKWTTEPSLGYRQNMTYSPIAREERISNPKTINRCPTTRCCNWSAYGQRLAVPGREADDHTPPLIERLVSWVCGRRSHVHVDAAQKFVYRLCAVTHPLSRHDTRKSNR